MRESVRPRQGVRLKAAGYVEPLHPHRKDALTPLERDLWRLGMVAQEAQTLLRGLNHYRDAAKTLNDDILFSLANQATIIVCKFLEVWRATSSHAEADPRVIRCRRALQPIIDRISVWKGLDLFRSCTLAHPYLTSDGKLIPPPVVITRYGVPTYHAEVLLLLRLVHYCVLGFLSAFKTEFLAVWPLTSDERRPLEPAPGIELGAQIDPELRLVLAKVDVALGAEGLSIDSAFGREFESRLRPPADGP